MKYSGYIASGIGKNLIILGSDPDDISDSDQRITVLLILTV